MGIVRIFLVENCPWCILFDLGPMTNLARLGEWAWVGRVYT